MIRMICTMERDGKGSWEFRSYRALVVDAPDLTAGVRAYRDILTAAKEEGGGWLDEDEAVPDTFGVCPMDPLGRYSGGCYVYSGPDRKHSSEAFDELFSGYEDAVTVTIAGEVEMLLRIGPASDGGLETLTHDALGERLGALIDSLPEEVRARGRDLLLHMEGRYDDLRCELIESNERL